mmetsp:Transcript_36402/g.27003  ORF Transcript_36402/g.27003 Transcript_36402/m.27003 type:complete len:137 (+) Transcript_36402:102-512(+)
MDKNFQSADSQALFVLTDLIKDYLREVSSEVNAYSELNGRYESNLIDVLNAASNYSLGKKDIQGHIECKELTLNPLKSANVAQFQANLQDRGLKKISNMKAMGEEEGTPEYVKRLRTLPSIPDCFKQVLPSKMAFH